MIRYWILNVGYKDSGTRCCGSVEAMRSLLSVATTSVVNISAKQTPSYEEV
jgi:hypothetical protein